MLDIQAKLDEWLEENPDAQEHVTKLYHVAEGDDPPDDATHAVRLASVIAPGRGLTIAAVCTPTFSVFLEALLALAATQPTS